MTQTTWIIAEIFAGIALLTLLTAFVTRWFGPTAKRGPAEILQERYARGELSRNEYRQMADDLGITIPLTPERPVPLADGEREHRSSSGRALEP